MFSCHLNGKIIAKSGNVFDNVQRAISFNQRNRGVDRMPSIGKKRLLRKKLIQLFVSALQKNKSTRASGSMFEERIEEAKKAKLELELIEIIDCFLDGHGIFDSNLVSLKLKCL